MGLMGSDLEKQLLELNERVIKSYEHIKAQNRPDFRDEPQMMELYYMCRNNPEYLAVAITMVASLCAKNQKLFEIFLTLRDQRKILFDVTGE